MIFRSDGFKNSPGGLSGLKLHRNMKNKIYISGKITGLDITEAQEKFNRYESSLISEGFEVINPMKVSPFHQDKTWNDYMRDCVRALCDCEMIGMMPCWQTSKGAQIEKEIAEKIGIMVCYL